MKRIGDLLPPIPSRPGGEDGPARTPFTPPPPACPICKDKGYLVYDVEPGDPRFSQRVPCRCTQARLAAERAREQRDISNLGALERMTFESFIPDGVALPEAARISLHQAYDLSYRYAQNPEGWLLLMGGYGAGKTHLAVAVANYNLALGRPALFVVVPDLLDHLRAAYGPSSETGLDARMEAIRDAPLLILDDLGAHNSTPWAQEKLYQIVNHRYNARLATVITTNQRLEELDPRIASRLADLDLSQLVDINAPDYRGGMASSLGTANRGERALNTLAYYDSYTFDAFSLREGDEMFDDQRVSLRAALEQARAYAQHPKGWLVFFGAFGSGKTHLAAAIANFQMKAGRPAPMFVTVPDLLDYLRATFAPNAAVTLDRAFDQIKNAWLLVLDDLGTENATPWAKEKLFQLLNHRYVARLPTIITTNQTIERTDAKDTRGLIDPHLASRMMDVSRSQLIFISSPTFRGSRSQEQAVRRGRPRRP